jgi:hypothetical protein
MYRKRFGVARTAEDGPRYVQGGVPTSHLWTKDMADARRFDARETALWVADQAGEGARVVEIFDFVDDEASYRQLEGVCQEMLMALRMAEALIDGPGESRMWLRHAIEQAEAILGVGDRP